MINQQSQKKPDNDVEKDVESGKRLVKKGIRAYKKFYKKQIGVLRLRHEMTRLESEMAQNEVKRIQAISFLATIKGKDVVTEKEESDGKQPEGEM